MPRTKTIIPLTSMLILAACASQPKKPLLLVGPLHAAIETQNVIGSGDFQGILRQAVAEAAPGHLSASVRELSASPDFARDLGKLGDCAAETCLLQVAGLTEAQVIVTLSLRLTSEVYDLTVTVLDPRRLTAVARSVSGPTPTSDADLNSAVEVVVAETLQQAGDGLAAPWRLALGAPPKTTRRVDQAQCQHLLERTHDLPNDDRSKRDREKMIQLLQKLLPETPKNHPGRARILHELATLYWERVRAMFIEPGYCKYFPPCPANKHEFFAQKGFNACDDLLELTAKGPRTDHVLFLRGCHQLGLGNTEGAKADFARLAKRFPQSQWIALLQEYSCL